MDIQSINNGFNIPSRTQKKPVLNSGESEKKAMDKLDISEQAKNMGKVAASDKKDLSEIKAKVNSKFYDSDKVIEKVAENILNEII
ncbi:MAG: hypothetical protein K9J16_02405 [Melioribacteraceae bacterium]|nr:hypothetical protein [Melioribacteraceae bacterium]MCF8353750.1 hypothetical protein [Melioribacteraceae bacterium]MCF8392441.1 hypothetical protein [Melioribacteraceae bacterium]MCF8418352.1 hypothetical protein [Melioribacteraceae bacterium]